MAKDWLEELNPPQRRAATHPGGPVLVIAGAGTGKTRTLASRVAWLIQQGVAPQRILLLTFTRRAAAEMIARASRVSGAQTAARVWGGTFHAMGHRLLRQHARQLGLPAEFTVIDQSDAADLINLIRHDLGLAGTQRRFPRKDTLLSIYSRAVNSRTPLGPLLERHYPWCRPQIDGIREIFQQYTQRKRRQGLLDYDDLLLYWKSLVDLLPGIADGFDHILVDEYQDTNALQSEILQAMRARRRDIMVVGDDAQSIYSFRAATVRNILDFPQQFPGADTVTLEHNYRSTMPILAASNAVMLQARQRHTKNLYCDRTEGGKPTLVACLDEADQCEQVCQRILQAREEGLLLRQQAVLFRAGHHSDQLEVELSRRNIPFVKYGGLKFVEAAHVKDLLAFLRLLENPHDELSWFRVLLLLEGVGPVTAARMMQDLGIRRRDDASMVPDPSSSPLRLLQDHPPLAPAAAAEQWAKLRQAIIDCAAFDTAQGLDVSAQVDRARRFYEPICQRRYDNATARLRDLEQLQQIASRYRSRGEFLADLTLDPPQSAQDLAGPPLLDEDYLILSTIHSAKGCEWEAVHILHVADGMIPSDMATGCDEEIDEERRLLYVAMTRAKRILNLYFPLRYYHHPAGRSDRHSYAQLSRFLTEPVLACLERVTSPIASAGGQGGQTTPAAVAANPTAAIDAVLADLWRA